MLHSDFVPLPRWKICILDFVARQLGILIRINGLPFGAYGAMNGLQNEICSDDDYDYEAG